MKTRLITTCLLSISLQPLCAQEARPIEDKEAKQLIDEFKKTIKASKKNLGSRVKAVQELGRRSNGLLVKPLLKLARSDRAKTVRQEATIALGNQPAKQARGALNMLLKKTSITSEPNVTAAIVKAYGGGSYRDKDYKTFKSMFERSLADQRCVAAQIAIIELFGKQQEIQAAEYLARHIDAPEPVNVDSASNPPASYWEARYKNWQKWRQRLKETLYQISGQRFGTSKEAGVWLRKNRRALKQRKAKSSKQKSKSKK